jgi:hypothetical protein
MKTSFGEYMQTKGLNGLLYQRQMLHLALRWKCTLGNVLNLTKTNFPLDAMPGGNMIWTFGSRILRHSIMRYINAPQEKNTRFNITKLPFKYMLLTRFQSSQ